MASTADQLSALSNDPQFRLRIQSLLVQQAAAVYAEDSGIVNHAARIAYAKAVLSNPVAQANTVAIVMANRTNLVAGTTTYNFTGGYVQTDVTDAAISSQLTTDWNMLAGV